MTDEILKDAELDKVVGGTGVETMALMSRLQAEGLATFTTPLVAGNEKAAAQELKAYLVGLKDGNGYPMLQNPQVYADGRANEYFHDMHFTQGGEYTNDTDLLIDLIKAGGLHNLFR